VKFLNKVDGGARGQAILDAVGRSVGAHHQKAVVVQNADGRLAFVGGIDLAMGRWDTPEHLPNDERARGGRNPANAGFHDTHCMIEGPAVDDVETNFRQRWNNHPDGRTRGAHASARCALRQKGLDPIPRATHAVQINRTIPPGVPAFPFVSPEHGDPGARLARVNAIRRARRYVYIEDQYLTMVDSFDHANLLASPDPLAFVPSAPDTDRGGAARADRRPEPARVRGHPLPRTLGEDPRFADGVLYEMRKRFITFLTHGLSDDLKAPAAARLSPAQPQRAVHLRPRQEHDRGRRVGQRRVEQHRLPQPDLRHRDQLRRGGRRDRARGAALCPRPATGALARAPAAGPGLGGRRARSAPRLRDAAVGR
jgi:hypothetical protein